MKQLIPQSRIDEATANATENRFDLKGLIAYGDIYEQGFKRGIQFALNEIQPLMVEFAEWCNFGNHPYAIDNWCVSENYKKWHDDNGTFITTQQMFEIFIKERNNKDE